MSAGLRFRCTACGAEVTGDTLPFRCPAADGDDADHLLVGDWDGPLPPPDDARDHPFLRYRERMHFHAFGRARGLSDAELVDLVRRLDDSVAAVDGSGFRVTPLVPAAAVGAALGLRAPDGLLVKDETAHVAGSHKARHLFGVILALEVRARLGLPPDRAAPLAIASCGNAALAAAVLARAAERPLEVFVPPAADEDTLHRLRGLGARVTVCSRDAAAPGDPSVRCFRAAVAAGAVPFTVQGSENGLAIEGGRTLGWEIADELVAGRRAADRLLVQVGGGALASACAAALRDAVRSGRLHRTPRLHPVQTAGGHPLERAYSRVVERAYREADETLPPDAPGVAEHLRRRFDGAAVRRALTRAATHRSEFMWPWGTPPVSLAEGILDDETYDWRAVVEGTLQSGGWPVVVDEDDVRRANELLREHTAAPSSFTGSAGVAGALRLARERALGPEETVVVLATGRRRDTSAV